MSLAKVVAPAKVASEESDVDDVSPVSASGGRRKAISYTPVCYTRLRLEPRDYPLMIPV